MIDRDNLIEAMARDAYIAHHENGPFYLDAPDMGRGGFKTEVSVWRAVAQSALAAHDAWLKANGLVVVPREPTEAMRWAGAEKLFGSALADWGKNDAVIAYRAMIAAANELKEEPNA